VILPLMVDFILTMRNDGCTVDEIGLQVYWHSGHSVPLHIPEFITFRESFPFALFFVFCLKFQYFQISLTSFLKICTGFLYDIQKSRKVKIKGFLFIFQEIEQKHLGYASL
jgi:hypothetical protein